MSYRGQALLFGFALVSALACPPQASAAEPPGTQLRARLEAHLAARKESLKESPSHYALVFELPQADLAAFMKQITVFQDGTDYVLGVPYGPESHGGGLLALLLEAWKPNSRAANLQDRFWFSASRGSLQLDELYRGYKRQLFLPVPGRDPARIDGELPDAAQLPRMRFRYGTADRFVENDAYQFLGLLIANEKDFGASWRNHLGQDLSVDLLMRNARTRFLADRSTDTELEDHSYLHLVELLLAYDRRRGDRQHPNEIKRRFLRVELARQDFEGDDGTEALGHYVESLGLLLDDPAVTWEAGERKQVMAWLSKLERDRFRDLGPVPIQHLSHLLKGLRLVEANRDRLEGAGPGGPPQRVPGGR